jgi:hypothetical protein
VDILSSLLIIGAGGHGRCCLDIALSMNQFDKIAFLDDKETKMINGIKVLGTAQALEKYYPVYDDIVVAIGNNTVRKQVMEKAKEIGYNLVNLKHPSAVISYFANIGCGNVIFPNVVIEANSYIGYGNVICANTVVNHDATIKNYCLIYSNTTIRPESVVNSMVRIESNCCIGFGAILPEGSDVNEGSSVQENV